MVFIEYKQYPCPNTNCKTIPNNNNLLLCKEYMFECAECGTLWHPKTNCIKMTHEKPLNSIERATYEVEILELIKQKAERDKLRNITNYDYVNHYDITPK